MVLHTMRVEGKAGDVLKVQENGKCYHVYILSYCALHLLHLSVIGHMFP
jgi:hypothetical protein